MNLKGYPKMTRILYGIAKEGMGHAVRSKVIINELEKKHKVLILAGGKQYSYLSSIFGNVIRIEDFDLTYVNNSISFTLTFLRNLLRSPLIIYSLIKNISKIRKYDPDIIISDFEPLSNYLSYFLRKPLIAIDNQHIITKCKITCPKKFKKDFIISYLTISAIITNARYFIVNSFISLKPKVKNVFVVNPIIRPEIIQHQTTDMKHIIVYQTSDSNNKLIPILKKTHYSYIFYGDKKGKEQNITFKKFCEKEFIEDLASCSGVITNGGFGLISEALYLKKPVLSIPIRKQFEQILNALHLKMYGYGSYSLHTTENAINSFIKNLPTYRKNLSRYKKYDNKVIFDKLNQIISSS